MRLFKPLKEFKTKGPCPGVLVLYGSNESVKSFYEKVFMAFQSRWGSYDVVPIERVEQIQAPVQDSFFQDQATKQQQIYVLEKAGDRDLKAHLPLWPTLKAQGSLLIVKTSLATKSKLALAAFESPHVWAVGCYELTPQDLRVFIQDLCADQGVLLEPTALNFLAETYGIAPLRLFADLKKLALLQEGRSEPLSLAEVQDLCIAGVDTSVDDICTYFLKRQPQELAAFMVKNYLSDEFLKIHRVVLQMVLRFLEFVQGIQHQGLSPEKAFQSLSTPVFFQQKALFEQCQALWTLPQLVQVLQQLLYLEKAFKNNELKPHDEPYFLAQVLESHLIRSH